MIYARLVIGAGKRLELDSLVGINVDSNYLIFKNTYANWHFFNLNSWLIYILEYPRPFLLVKMS